MRRSSVLAVWCVVALVAACTSPTSSATDDPRDAGTEDAAAAPDASVAPDAGAPDAAMAPDAALPTVELRVATYNVHRFFDTVCDTGECTSSSYEEVTSQAQLNERASEIAAAIRDMDADVVMLQEVETAQCMDAIQAALGAEYPTAVLGETGGEASVDVAVFSRLPHVETRTHRNRQLMRPDGSPTWFAREFLEVRLSAEGHTVIAFAAHFRSKSNDDPGRRLAEAQEALEVMREVAAAEPDALIVLGGDLNDVPGSDPMNALETGGYLLRVASELPDDDEATYTFFGDRQAIDHLLLSTEAGGSYVTGTTVVHGEGRGYFGSDHSAVSARFRMPR